MKKSLYEKIEQLYGAKSSSEPIWVNELREELRAIKALLQANSSTSNLTKKRRKSKAYFEFVELFRKKLMADVERDIYPEVHYEGRRIGVNIKGFLYDKATTKSLKAYEAFALYEHFYAKKEQIDSFIITH